MDRRLKVNFSPWTNFGDTCVPYMLKKLNVPFIFSHHTVEDKILMIGSILGVGNRRNTVVWGTGIIDKTTRALPDAKYLAVRGYKTLEKLNEANVDTNNIAIGDPALLLPRIYQPTVTKQYKLGIIPHMVDHSFVMNYVKENKDMFPDTIVLDPNTPVSKIENFIDDVNRCEKVISTCLHGLICAHAYGIPATWMKVSDRLAGDDIKFYDHFSAINIDFDKPLEMIKSSNIDVNVLPNNYNSDMLWECRPWALELDDKYYVDINSESWTSHCYPDGYEGKIVDDKWWEK